MACLHSEIRRNTGNPSKGQGLFKDAQNVEHMNKDSALNRLRQDHKELLDESRACRKLWVEVDALLRGASAEGTRK